MEHGAFVGSWMSAVGHQIAILLQRTRPHLTLAFFSSLASLFALLNLLRIELDGLLQDLVAEVSDLLFRSRILVVVHDVLNQALLLLLQVFFQQFGCLLVVDFLLAVLVWIFSDHVVHFLVLLLNHLHQHLLLLLLPLLDQHVIASLSLGLRILALHILPSHLLVHSGVSVL